MEIYGFRSGVPFDSLPRALKKTNSVRVASKIHMMNSVLTTSRLNISYTCTEMDRLEKQKYTYCTVLYRQYIDAMYHQKMMLVGVAHSRSTGTIPLLALHPLDWVLYIDA